MLPPCLAPQIIASKFDDQDMEEAIMEQISDMDDDSNDDHGELKVGDSYGNRASQTAPSTPRWTSCGVRLPSTAQRGAWRIGSRLLHSGVCCTPA